MGNDFIVKSHLWYHTGVNMNFLKIIILLLLSINLFANPHLKRNYFIQNNFVLLSDITENKKDTTQLFQIPPDRHSKRIKAKELLKILTIHGYKNHTSKHSYIQFTKKSPINIQNLQYAIIQRYKEKYTDIEIKAININPRSYLTSLPKSYSIVLNKKTHLKRSGTFYIKTDDNKKIFFNYTISAKIDIIKARVKINKGDELSNRNTKKSSIMLDKFRAMPLQKITKAVYESKRRLQIDTILTTRDVSGLFLVKRGSKVNVMLINSGISISFLAKAIQSGKYGESIFVVNSNGKKIAVIVTGRNKVEAR